MLSSPKSISSITFSRLARLVWKSKSFKAVKGISLDIYENEIFGLLGSNGAGKTTLINMLSGMLPITSGTANINGLDVTNNMKSKYKTR